MSIKNNLLRLKRYFCLKRISRRKHGKEINSESLIVQVQVSEEVSLLSRLLLSRRRKSLLSLIKQLSYKILPLSATFMANKI